MTRQTRRGASLIDVTVALTILLVLFTLLMPGCRRSNHVPASRRSQCKNNLKQIGLALHNYHDAHKAFPPGWVAVQKESLEGEGLKQSAVGGAYGWSTFILPFLDQTPLFNEFDFNQPLGTGANATKLVSTVLTTAGCPSDTGPRQTEASVIPGIATTNYVANFGVGLPTVYTNAESPPLQGIFGGNSHTQLRDLTDGTSNIVLVGERSLPTDGRDWRIGAAAGRFNSNWFGIPSVSRASPLSIVGTVTGDPTSGDQPLSTRGNLTEVGTDAAPGKLAYFGINRAQDGTSLDDFDTITAGFSSRHEGGFHVLLADGSVRFISEEIDRRILVNLMRHSDGARLGEF